MYRFFEFNELDSAPKWYHMALREHLTISYRAVRHHFLWQSPLIDFLKRNQLNTVLDVGSGEMGPVPSLLNVFEDEEWNVILSDLLPQQEHLQYVDSLNLKGLSYYPSPVDATNIPDDLKYPRIFANVFHHFTPSQAQTILEDSLQKDQSVIILEYVNRSIFAFLLINIPSLILPILFFPFYRNKSLKMFLFTYIIPLFQLMLVWDGLVSCWRFYSKESLEKILNSSAVKDQFEIESGTKRNLLFPSGVNWNIITRKKLD